MPEKKSVGFGFESINPVTGSYDTLLVVHVGGDPQDLDMEFVVGDADTLNNLLGDDDVYSEAEGVHLFDGTKMDDWKAAVRQRGQNYYGHPFELTPQEMSYVTPEQWAEWDRRQAENAQQQGF
jgi:hypothetical protein